MIVVDYSQVCISNIMVELMRNKATTVELDLIRHMIINSIRSYKTKFGSDYGELVICCDAANNWRKGVFEYYKAVRRKNREESDIDWPAIYKCIDTVREELKQYFPYKVIQVDGAEADDVIAVLAKWSQSNDLKETMFDSEPKPFLILSRDSDFVQLQKYDNVVQYSPIDKKWVKPVRTAELDLMEKIIRGDSGDGIVNILSDDDTFVNSEKRQKSIFKDKLEVWLTQRSEEFCTTDTMKAGFERNRKLIDFDYIPTHISDAIINCFESYASKGRSQLMNYFVKNKMKLMLEHITEF